MYACPVRVITSGGEENRCRHESFAAGVNYSTQATGINDTCGKDATVTAGVDDTVGKFATGVNAAGGKLAAGVNDTEGKLSPAELEEKNFSSTQRYPNKIIKTFLFEVFPYLPLASLTPVVHLELQISPKKSKWPLMGYSGAWGKLINEKTDSRKSLPFMKALMDYLHNINNM